MYFNQKGARCSAGYLQVTFFGQLIELFFSSQNIIEKPQTLSSITVALCGEAGITLSTEGCSSSSPAR